MEYKTHMLGQRTTCDGQCQLNVHVGMEGCNRSGDAVVEVDCQAMNSGSIRGRAAIEGCQRPLSLTTGKHAKCGDSSTEVVLIINNQ